jgi:hypothetical protein
MIDTVILVMEAASIRVIKDERVPDWELHSQSKAFSKFTKNQTALQKKDGVYRPRVTGIKRGNSRVTRVEFSVPKLLFCNNVEEVTDIDFSRVVTTLRERLADMGIVVSDRTLREAGVTAFHPSKNVILTGAVTVGEVLNELAKVNLTQKMELTKQTFYNGGESLQFWSKSNSLVIYDKKRDYGKSKGAATDKDRVPFTQSFLDQTYSLPEILRIEVRLSEKRKVNEIFEKLGYAINPTFQEVFNQRLCQAVVRHYWKNLVTGDNGVLLSAPLSPQGILSHIKQERKEIGHSKALFLVGLILTAKDSGGATGLRKTLGISSRSWYRLVEDLRNLGFLTDNQFEWVAVIEEQLSTFKPVRLADWSVKYCKV